MKELVTILFGILAVCNAAHIKQNATGTQWALLVAGSSGWDNYRHQADVSHAYHILLKRGVPASNIVVMMYDDVAHDPQNPQPGKLINKPGGHDVYKGVKIDYKGKTVTPKNFLNILAGNKKALHGIGTGRVIESGANDNVFVNFADHGGAGILCFPNDDLNAKDLINTLKQLTKQKSYAKLLLYIEACEAGSNFDNLLPENTHILASTASASDESSWGCYCDYKTYPCLGDLYSVNWMEHLDQKIPDTENLFDQYQIIRTLTNMSHVNLYGDYRVGPMKTKEFIGPHSVSAEDEQTSEVSQYEQVSSRDATLYFYKRMAKTAENESVRKEFTEKVNALEKKREFIDNTVQTIVEKVADNDEDLMSQLISEHNSFTEESLECHIKVYKHFSKRCFNLNKNQYVLGHFYKFANICLKGADYGEKAIEAIDSTCPEDFPVITGAM